MDISQINLPRTVVQSEDLINSVNEVLSKHYMNIILQLDIDLPIHDLMINDEPKKVQLEKVFKCEIDSGLWDKALVTALSDITHKSCPHVFVIQSLVNYALNVYLTTDLGAVIDIFSRLVMFLPPVSPQAKEYYHSILHTKYVQLHEKKPEELNLFWCLIDNLLSCTENKKDLDDFDSVTLTSLAHSLPERIKQLSRLFYGTQNKKIDNNQDKTIIYFDELPIKEKVKRCLTVLNFVYEILQAEFVYWFKSKGLMLKPFDKNDQLFLTSLIWDDVRDVGLLNNNLKKILKLQHNLQMCEESSAFWVVDKLVALIAEIMRFSDSLEERTYPFLGNNSNALAREISFNVLDRLKEVRKESKDVCDLTIHIKPSWLRLLVISHLLSVITGNPCAPELTSVVHILEHIADIKSTKENDEILIRRRSNPKADTKLIERFQKLPSVNSKLAGGRTRLHAACIKNNVEEIRALLTFPVLEINATDNDGLTALHHACYKGNTSSVKELLSFWPQLGEVQRPVDTRAIGREGFTPLMCAVVQGHSEVCRLLLEHTGSVLLEDINDDNKTALDLSKSEEVTKVLRHYKVNKKTTEHSKKKMHFSEENVDVVLEFSFQLVQSYFSVHRTWDVYHSLKSKTTTSRSEAIETDIHSKQNLVIKKRSNIEFCYLRYHRDLKTNIDKLRKITTKVKDVPEFRDFVEPLICILSLNKYHSS